MTVTQRHRGWGPGDSDAAAQRLRMGATGREAGGGEQKLLSWFWGPQSGLWGVPSTSLSSCSATAGETLTPQMQDRARGPGAGPHLAGVTAGPHRALWEEAAVRVGCGPEMRACR